MVSAIAYHIGKNGPAPCRAKVGKCPLGGKHFPSMDEAQGKYEQDLQKQYGTTTAFKRPLKYHVYNKIDNSPNRKSLHRSLKILRATGKGTLAVAAVGATVAVVTSKTAFKVARFTTSKVLRKPLSRRKRLNAKKLLMTKYWMPDIHSKKWK